MTNQREIRTSFSIELIFKLDRRAKGLNLNRSELLRHIASAYVDEHPVRQEKQIPPLPKQKKKRKLRNTPILTSKQFDDWMRELDIDSWETVYRNMEERIRTVKVLQEILLTVGYGLAMKNLTLEDFLMWNRGTADILTPFWRLPMKDQPWWIQELVDKIPLTKNRSLVPTE